LGEYYDGDVTSSSEFLEVVDEVLKDLNFAARELRCYELWVGYGKKSGSIWLTTGLSWSGIGIDCPREGTTD
jgi:hypothetical protein